MNFLDVHDKIAQLRAHMLMIVLDNNDRINSFKQSNVRVLYAHKRSKEESTIDWHETAFAIDCKARGMSPWLGIYFEHQNKNRNNRRRMY